ncbi:mechanosensitive ion channel family protein [Asaia krungthepensis]|uniref:Mechanosensitive ion channel protein MscS n=1 Tax=Asaia krungthepensis NRIC 0535 TaxID=1307925 RepID=A0ABQ0Q6Q1_9PROT|nr:mechanosensitive ion channel domain-containing protein [Asaia krungthepensis]GBQ93801.1 mechanosensitive ion channel protein MscS [Asaia krungthepensis NRIC 0535]
MLSPSRAPGLCARFPTLMTSLSAVLICAMLVFGVQGAWAQSAAPESAAPKITADQARQLASVLNDEGKRREFLTTLQNLTQAQQATGGKASPEKTGPQLKPDGLGAELLGSASDWTHAASVQAHSLLRTVVDVRAIGPWWRHMRNNPADRQESLKLLTRALILAVVSSCLFYALRFLLRGVRGRVEALARVKGRTALAKELDDRQAAQDAADEAAQGAASQETANETLSSHNEFETAPEPRETEEGLDKERLSRLRHQGALARLTLVLKRLPYSFLCLLLDCVPVLVVPFIALLIVVVDPAADEYTTALLRALSLTALISAGLIIAIRAILAPKRPWLRLAMFSDSAAVFLFDWLRLLVMTTGISAAAFETLDDCGLPDRVNEALLKILTLVLHLMVAVMILRSRPRVMRFCDRGDRRGAGANLLHFFGRTWWVVALFFDMGLWLVWAAEIHHGYAAIWKLFLRSALALVIMRCVSIVLYGVLERVFRKAPGWVTLSEDAQTRFTRYYAPAQRVTSIIIIALTVLALASAWGAPIKALFGVGGLGYRLISSSMTVLIACLLGIVVWEASNVMLERYARKVGGLDDGAARVARVRTLQPMIRIVLMVVLVAVIGLTILSEIGVNVAPLLAGASIFGVALGFGSQKLVQDFINGIFLLMENALTVGDAVTLNGTYGVVEHLSLRTVHVRANDGSMNIFPFSSLGQIINYNRDFARAIIVAEVGYETDTDEVVSVINDITAEMRADDNFKNLIIDDFQMWGVDALNQTSVTVRGTLPTITSGRWPVQREFYRRLKKTFEARGIHLPYPTRFVEVTGLAGAQLDLGGKALHPVQTDTLPADAPRQSVNRERDGQVKQEPGRASESS